uniref:Uncharacterized protein n=1 Tax=Oncorhynchus kisutch TaxID=8019 RepID=A0A8C7I1K3_ONCKI
MVSAGPRPEAVGPVPGQESGGRRLSWPVLLLTLAAVTSSSLSPPPHPPDTQSSPHHPDPQPPPHPPDTQSSPHPPDPQSSPHPPDTQSSPHHPESQTRLPFIRERSVSTGPENTVSQPCLQMLIDSNRETFQKEFALEPQTEIPWQEAESDSILVREEGYYFVYSQVSTGHLHERTWSIISLDGDSSFLGAFRLV